MVQWYLKDGEMMADGVQWWFMMVNGAQVMVKWWLRGMNKKGQRWELERWSDFDRKVIPSFFGYSFIS